MAESREMVALKKAYADIILNTAKEAANRIMASEKKAIQYQHDLFSTKDEALRLLVRLKQMIDAKITEGEMASSSQQAKIDELEAQLQEAEGVIIDLRDELHWVRDKLERLRNGQLQPLNGNITGDNEFSYQNATYEPYILPPNPELPTVITSDMKNTLVDQRVSNENYCSAEQTEQLSVFQFERHSVHNAELASVITINEEHELLRNGCTQRIPTLEGNLQAGKLSPPGEVDENSFIKSDLLIRRRNKGYGKCNVPSPKIISLEPAKNCSGEEVRKRAKVRTSKRRRTRFSRPKAKRRLCPSQIKKNYQPPAILSHCKRYLANGNANKPDELSCTLPSINNEKMDMKKHSSEMEEKFDRRNKCFMDENEEKRHRNVQSRDAMPNAFASYPDEHETCSFSLYSNGKSGEVQPKIVENEVKLKSFPRLDPGLTLIKGGVDPTSRSRNVTLSVKASNRCGFVQNTANKDMESVDEVLKQDHEAATKSTFPCYETNPESVNIPLMYSDLKDAKAFTEQGPHVDHNGLLKYTFQRKRKKEALSSPDQRICEKSTVKRRTMERQNDSPEPLKSGVTNESSRDSRRLAQVARQVGFFLSFPLLS
ncbi:hypothetical protein JCGZ_09681 [Jatropha curcas]|uniref:Uncharacterized protein n=1 Tax=Jatropha curcas TaxID=180498 RepID=A0A067LAJ7_JATCU|nr:hypothetical protein JCGZ_09681 [Jatropha curcas]